MQKSRKTHMLLRSSTKRYGNKNIKIILPILFFYLLLRCWRLWRAVWRFRVTRNEYWRFRSSNSFVCVQSTRQIAGDPRVTRDKWTVVQVSVLPKVCGVPVRHGFDQKKVFFSPRKTRTRRTYAKATHGQQTVLHDDHSETGVRGKNGHCTRANRWRKSPASDGCSRSSRATSGVCVLLPADFQTWPDSKEPAAPILSWNCAQHVQSGPVGYSPRFETVPVIRRDRQLCGFPPKVSTDVSRTTTVKLFPKL